MAQVEDLTAQVARNLVFITELTVPIGALEVIHFGQFRMPS